MSAYFEVYKDRAGEYRWRLKARARSSTQHSRIAIRETSHARAHVRKNVHGVGG